MFSRAWHQLYVFPRLAPVKCFPALSTGYMFSRAWHPLHVFPHLEPLACFPALGTRCMFSRAWHRLHVFPRLAQVAYFPALGSRSMFFLRVQLYCPLRYLHFYLRDSNHKRVKATYNSVYREVGVSRWNITHGSRLFSLRHQNSWQSTDLHVIYCVNQRLF